MVSGPASQRWLSRAAQVRPGSPALRRGPGPGQGLGRPHTARAELEIRGELTLQPRVRGGRGLRGLRGARTCPRGRPQPVGVRAGVHRRPGQPRGRHTRFTREQEPCSPGPASRGSARAGSWEGRSWQRSGSPGRPGFSLPQLQAGGLPGGDAAHRPAARARAGSAADAAMTGVQLRAPLQPPLLACAVQPSERPLGPPSRSQAPKTRETVTPTPPVQPAAGLAPLRGPGRQAGSALPAAPPFR